MAKRKTSASEGKLWGGLKLSWTAFRIAKAKGKKKQMKEIAGTINSLQDQLGLKRTSFRIG